MLSLALVLAGAAAAEEPCRIVKTGITEEYKWCGEFGGCKGPHAVCERMNGVLDTQSLPAECSETCVGESCKACLYTTTFKMDETRVKERMLVDEQVDYLVIYDHPEYLRKETQLPLIVPEDQSKWSKRQPHLDAKSVETADCSQFIHAGVSFSVDVLGREYQSCADAKAAALRWTAVNRAVEHHGPDILEEDDMKLCPDKPEMNGDGSPVLYKFGGVTFNTCRDAMKAARDLDNQQPGIRSESPTTYPSSSPDGRLQKKPGYW